MPLPGWTFRPPCLETMQVIAFWTEHRIQETKWVAVRATNLPVNVRIPMGRRNQSVKSDWLSQDWSSSDAFRNDCFVTAETAYGVLGVSEIFTTTDPTTRRFLMKYPRSLSANCWGSLTNAAESTLAPVKRSTVVDGIYKKKRAAIVGKNEKQSHLAQRQNQVRTKNGSR